MPFGGGSRTRITNDAQDAEILAKRAPDRVLARAFGLTKVQIQNRRYNLRQRKFPTRYGGKPSVLAPRIAKVREVLGSGLTLAAAAKKLRVTKGTLAGFVRRRKLRRRPIRRFDDPRTMVIE